MNKLLTTLLVLAFYLPTSSSAALLLEVDLSQTNTISISATTGSSGATVSGSDTTGFYLEDFFAANINSINYSLVSGDLTSALNTTDLSPALWRQNGSDTGLNVWSYTDDSDSEFQSGVLAFSGSASWTISSGAYADALAGAVSGLIYFPADDIGDLTSQATEIGEWSRVSPVPVPAAVWLFGTALIGFLGISKRRKVA